MLILKSNFSFIDGYSALIFLIFFILSCIYPLRYINKRNGFDFLKNKSK
jgi:hypothetical protein